MGQNNSKKSLKTINDDVQTIRSNIRLSQGKLNPGTKEALEHALINYSKQVDRMGRHTKRKSIENTQKLIVKTTNELLSNNIEENLDRGAIETDSFINLTKTKRSIIDNNNNSRNLSTLDDVEKAINSLKLDINVAISNNDKDRLIILKKSIENLATNLEMIQVNDYIDLQTRKEYLEKTLQKLYGKINKNCRQIERDDNIQYLTEYQQKQQKLIKDLADVETIVENSQLTIDELEELKKQLHEIDGGSNNETVQTRKQEILMKIQKKWENITIIEEKLQQAIDSLMKFQMEIEKICKNPNIEESNKADNYLKQLQEYVGKLPEIHREFSEKRQQFYEKLEQSSNLLKQTTTTRNIVGFYNYWMELQEDFHLEKYNISELSNIQQLLSTLMVLIQRKIEEIGEFVQNKQQSKDSPDLVKVRVKITETPTLRTSINHQQINDIKSELIKLKNNEIGDNNHDVEKLLDNYQEILQRYQSNSVDNLLELIEEIRENLHENLQCRRCSSTDDILNEIFLIRNRVNDYDAKLKDTNLTPVEFQEIHDNLQQYRNNLNSLNLKNSNIKKVSIDVLQQIDEYLCKFNNDKNQEELKKRVNLLKEKIDRFSGTYKNVLYKKLEDDLNDCLIQAIDPQLQNEIKNYLKILEEKSIKDVNYNNNNNRPVTIDIRDKLSKIRQDVDDVINDLSNNDMKTKDDYLALDGRLTLSILALDNLQIIKDRNLIEERENLYHEIQRYLNYINEKITLADQAPPIQEFNDNTNENNDNDDDDDVIIVELRTEKMENQQDAIEEIESKFERIKREINEFIGDQTDEKFIKLDDQLIEITLDLDRYKFEKNTILNNKKLQLLKNIQNACELLDEKINHFVQLEQIEKQINEISIKIQQLDNYTDYDYNRLDEQLINLNVKTRKLQVDGQLLEKRNNCIRMIEDCFRKLSEIPKNCKGTLV